MNCSKCNCSDSVKSGLIKGRQRYKCKSCGCNYTVAIKSTAKSASFKKQALHLYLEGLGYRSIGRFLGVSNVSVLNWIRDLGPRVQELRSAGKSLEIVEVDEMHAYVGKTKATVGYALLMIDTGQDLSTSLLATDRAKRQKIKCQVSVQGKKLTG